KRLPARQGGWPPREDDRAVAVETYTNAVCCTVHPSDGLHVHARKGQQDIIPEMDHAKEGNMRLLTLPFCLLAVSLISGGCGSNRDPAGVGGTREMIRVQTAFEELQKESSARPSQQEYTQQVNETLASIGDLGNSEKTADLG